MQAQLAGRVAFVTNITREETLNDYAIMLAMSPRPLDDRVIDQHVVDHHRPQRKAASWQGLQSITVDALELDKTHVQRVISGKVIVQPVHTASVGTVLEDDQGSVLKVNFYNFRAADRQSKFKPGQRMSIAEPHFTRLNFTTLGLRVENPTDVRFETGPLDQIGSSSN